MEGAAHNPKPALDSRTFAVVVNGIIFLTGAFFRGEVFR